MTACIIQWCAPNSYTKQMNTSKITVCVSTRALGCVLITLVIIFFQNKYKEKFNKERGKPYASTVDTPEIRRIKKVQDQLSEVDIKCGSVCSSSLPLIVHVTIWGTKMQSILILCRVSGENWMSGNRNSWSWVGRHLSSVQEMGSHYILLNTWLRMYWGTWCSNPCAEADWACCQAGIVVTALEWFCAPSTGLPWWFDCCIAFGYMVRGNGLWN